MREIKQGLVYNTGKDIVEGFEDFGQLGQLGILLTMPLPLCSEVWLQSGNNLVVIS